MSYDVAVTGALLVSWAALSVSVASVIKARAHVRASRVAPAVDDTGRAVCCDSMTTAPVAVSHADETWEAFATSVARSVSDDRTGDMADHYLVAPAIGARLDDASDRYPADDFVTTDDDFVMTDRTQAAIAACLFAAPRADHIWWTVMVVDPALHGTPSHIRLVGHYETELAAVDAADVLGFELNSCLVAGEAPLTTTALGIEPEVAINRPAGPTRPPVRQPESTHISPV